MKLKFKKQKFQTDAAKAVVNVFAGQPHATQNYLIDSGVDKSGHERFFDENFGAANYPVEVDDAKIFDNLKKIQIENNLIPSEKLEKIDGGYNLTIEMETGVGKTYTYIKTMYELNKHYGWSKFIIVVPSIAIREGVYKTFQVTQDHFAEEYEQKIKFFIYNSARLSEIEHFASDNSINAMIINSQAFNAKGNDARRIKMELDEFRSRRPIDVIASTNPILIIDEPQSVEGTKTKEGLKEFKPILTLRYSATHRDFYNLVYRLDAMDAYNKRLVKKICVTGIKTGGTTATEGFIYLEKLNLSKGAPTATIQFDCKGANGIRRVVRNVKQGDNLFELSNGLTEYEDRFVVRFIDGRDNSVEFLNEKKIFAGDVIGNVDEEILRRIQIRETIKAHLQKESQLFERGIKVLSLFFIDEVAHYKIYDEFGNPQNGDFAKFFEEEYKFAVEEFQQELFNDAYKKYLSEIPVERTHAGYFSIDKGKMVDSKLSNRKENLSDDINAYNLIMKNKELLLDLDAKKSPVRFIFSHSALREGWDNPNVFQICTLKQSSSDIRKRQEVGRGLRLCVNNLGERMDENFVGNEVHKINLLTVIAGESYDDFTRKLQSEIAESVGDRPRKVTPKLFVGEKIDSETAQDIYETLISIGYLKRGILTEKYYDDKENDNLDFPDEIADLKEEIIKKLDMVYNLPKTEDGRKNNVKATFDEKKFETAEFQELWSKINAKTAYSVDFDTDELIERAIENLNRNLEITKIYFRVESGELEKIDSKENLQDGTAFKKTLSAAPTNKFVTAESDFKYDLVGKIMAETGLMRKTIVKILGGIDKNVFEQFKFNPEEFILTAAKLINSEKAIVVVKHIKYKLTGEIYDSKIFSEANLSGNLNTNAMATEKNLYDYLISDSINEKKFAKSLESADEVKIYVKLPSKFYISTPVGKYNPDWAIVLRKGESKNIYFVAETKGSADEMQLREIERAKIACAREHFKTIAEENVHYEVVKDFDGLLNKLNR